MIKSTVHVLKVLYILQLLNLCLYTEEVDSLFCVTVISNHLLSPKKGHTVKLLIDRNFLQVHWFDSERNPRILCCHLLQTVTYQFHTSYKPRLYGYTAAWGRKKICLVFQAPRFSRTKVRPDQGNFLFFVPACRSRGVPLSVIAGGNYMQKTNKQNAFCYSEIETWEGVATHKSSPGQSIHYPCLCGKHVYCFSRLLTSQYYILLSSSNFYSHCT